MSGGSFAVWASGTRLTEAIDMSRDFNLLPSVMTRDMDLASGHTAFCAECGKEYRSDLLDATGACPRCVNKQRNERKHDDETA